MGSTFSWVIQIVAFILKTTRICKKLPNFGPEPSLVVRLGKKEKFCYSFYSSGEHGKFCHWGSFFFHLVQNGSIPQVVLEWVISKFMVGRKNGTIQCLVEVYSDKVKNSTFVNFWAREACSTSKKFPELQYFRFDLKLELLFMQVLKKIKVNDFRLKNL